MQLRAGMADRLGRNVVEAFARFEAPQRFEAKAKANVAELLLYDEIGFFGIKARDVVDALKAAGDVPVHVRVNSPGGEVFDGIAIFNALRNHAPGVTVTVDGLAASAASFIMLAGSSARAYSASQVMVHEAWGLSVGPAGTHRDIADRLEKMDGTIAAFYAAKSGQEPDHWRQLMAAETWFSGEEAVAAGLLDALVAEPSPAEESARAKAKALEDGRALRMMRARLAAAE